MITNFFGILVNIINIVFIKIKEFLTFILNLFDYQKMLKILYKFFCWISLLNQTSNIIYLGGMSIKIGKVLSIITLKTIKNNFVYSQTEGLKLDVSNKVKFYTYSSKVRSRQNHRWHYVDASPWPILMSYAIFFCAMGLLIIMHGKLCDPSFLYVGFLMLLVTVFLWWRDLVREVLLGHRTTVVIKNYKAGFLFFLVAEMMFFVPFFWAFFYFGLSFCVGIGGQWPGSGINAPLPFGIPMWNTGLLLLSGVACQFGVNAVETKRYFDVVLGLILTLILGFIFLFNQVIEYFTLPFSTLDGVFGSSFYLLTGLHGIHVLVGWIFLFICLVRYLKGDTATRMFLGFIFASWYWHFVDIIWLGLYLGVYIWTGLFKIVNGDFESEYFGLLILIVQESLETNRLEKNFVADGTGGANEKDGDKVDEPWYKAPPAELQNREPVEEKGVESENEEEKAVKAEKEEKKVADVEKDGDKGVESEKEEKKVADVEKDGDKVEESENEEGKVADVEKDGDKVEESENEEEKVADVEKDGDKVEESENEEDKKENADFEKGSDKI